MATSRGARTQRKAAVPPSPEEIEGQLEVLRERLRAEGAIQLSSVQPKAMREALASRLASEGYELRTTWLRRPLAEQVREALAHGAIVGKKDLPKRVRGATAAELTRALSELERGGELRRVLRGKVEAFAGAEARVLAAESLRALHGAVSELAKALGAASRKKGVTLVASDVEGLLEQALEVLSRRAGGRGGEAARGIPAALAPQRDEAARQLALSGSEASPRASLLGALDATVDERTGLSFVPRLMQRVMQDVPLRLAHEELLAAARDEVIELRPEGGLGRLSAEELALCPPGPGGTRLSWARRVDGVEAP